MCAASLCGSTGGFTTRWLEQESMTSGWVCKWPQVCSLTDGSGCTCSVGPRRNAMWEEATHMLCLLPLVSTEGKLGVWTVRDLGHFIACLLICAREGEVWFLLCSLHRLHPLSVLSGTWRWLGLPVTAGSWDELIAAPVCFHSMCCWSIRDRLLRVENIYNTCLGNMGGEYFAACFWLKQQHGDVFLVLREGWWWSKVQSQIAAGSSGATYMHLRQECYEERCDDVPSFLSMR